MIAKELVSLKQQLHKLSYTWAQLDQASLGTASTTRTSRRADTGSPYKCTKRFTSMDTTERRPYGLMNLMDDQCPLESFANLQTDSLASMKPREEVFLYPVSRKSSFQQSPILQPGGLDRTDSISIPNNFTEDSPSAITWELQEQPQMEFVNTPFLWNSTQESF
nr:putative ORF3 [Fur seal faeces associated circular DNA virus]